MVYPETRRAYREAMNRMINGASSKYKLNISKKQAEAMLTDQAIERLEMFRIDLGAKDRQGAIAELAKQRMNQNMLPDNALVVKYKPLTQDQLRKKAEAFNAEIDKKNLTDVEKINIAGIRNLNRIREGVRDFNATALSNLRSTQFYLNLQTVLTGLADNPELKKTDPSGELLAQVDKVMAKGPRNLSKTIVGKYVGGFEMIGYDSVGLNYGALRDLLRALDIDLSTLPNDVKSGMGLPTT